MVKVGIVFGLFVLEFFLTVKKLKINAHTFIISLRTGYITVVALTVKILNRVSRVL